MLHKSCIVLAGGVGTRLRSAVPSVPKCLASVGGQPFLRWQLESLARRGVEHFVLSLGYGFNQVLKAIQEPWAKKLDITYVIEREALGTGGAAYFAMIESDLTESLLVNGDTFLGGALDSMFVPLDIKSGELMRIATVKVRDRSRFGGVEVDHQNHVINFLEKGKGGIGQINAGFYRISIKVFADITCHAFSLETLVMPKLVFNYGLQVRQLSGPFIDIGIPEDYYLFDKSYERFTDYK